MNRAPPPFEPGELVVVTGQKLWLDAKPQATMRESWLVATECVCPRQPETCVYVTHGSNGDWYILRLLHPDHGIVLVVWFHEAKWIWKLETT